MKDLVVTEYKNKRVLTTEQLSEVYETDVKNIQMNFSNNKKRFIQGKDYYFLEGRELADFKNWVNDIGLVHKNARSLYLWTERGANRHCKILDTDKAWQQFDILEETYFKVKNNQLKLPMNYVEALEALLSSEKDKITLQNQNNQLSTIIESQKEKVETFDTVMSAESLYSFQKASAELNYKNMGQNKLYEILRQRGILMKNNIPYRPYIDHGYFKVIETVYHRNGILKTKHKTYFTAKGIHRVRKLLDQLGYKKNISIAVQ